jgi:hypothetical protein
VARLPVSDITCVGAPDGLDHRGPDAPSAHRRPGYPLSGCVPAEPDSVSPGTVRLTWAEQCDKPPSDTGVMPQKILPSRYPTEHNRTQLPTRFGKKPAMRERLGGVNWGRGPRATEGLGSIPLPRCSISPGTLPPDRTRSSLRSWSLRFHSQATEAGGFMVSATHRVGTVFYSCRSADRSPGMHPSHDDSKPELGEASPSDPRHSHGTPRPIFGRPLQPCPLLIQL